jgi:hypothetical protein
VGDRGYSRLLRTITAPKNLLKKSQVKTLLLFRTSAIALVETSVYRQLATPAEKHPLKPKFIGFYYELPQKFLCFCQKIILG